MRLRARPLGSRGGPLKRRSRFTDSRRHADLACDARRFSGRVARRRAGSCKPRAGGLDGIEPSRGHRGLLFCKAVLLGPSRWHLATRAARSRPGDSRAFPNPAHVRPPPGKGSWERYALAPNAVRREGAGVDTKRLAAIDLWNRSGGTSLARRWRSAALGAAARSAARRRRGRT